MAQPETTTTMMFEGTGLDTGVTLRGPFTVKLALSPRDLLRIEQIYREAVGDTTKGPPSQQAEYVAALVSQLTVRLKDAPAWWREAQNGVDLEDFNIMEDVYEQMSKLVATYNEARKVRAEAAKKAVELKIQDINAANK